MLQRLAAGAGAGMTATALTHPLDTLRLRLALPGSARQGPSCAWARVAGPGSVGFFWGSAKVLLEAQQADAAGVQGT